MLRFWQTWFCQKLSVDLTAPCQHGKLTSSKNVLSHVGQIVQEIPTQSGKNNGFNADTVYFGVFIICGTETSFFSTDLIHHKHIHKKYVCETQHPKDLSCNITVSIQYCIGKVWTVCIYIYIQNKVGLGEDYTKGPAESGEATTKSVHAGVGGDNNNVQWYIACILCSLFLHTKYPPQQQTIWWTGKPMIPAWDILILRPPTQPTTPWATLSDHWKPSCCVAICFEEKYLCND